MSALFPTEITIRANFRCHCPCGCTVMHFFSGDCALCKHGDHWTPIAQFLARIDASLRRRPKEVA